MDNIIEIDCLCIPAIRYNLTKKSIVPNKAFSQISKAQGMISKFHSFLQDSISNNSENSSYYLTYYLNNVEFLVNFIKINHSDEYIITLHKTSFMENAIREMTITKNIEREFYDILGVMHDDFVIINRNGVILAVLDNFEAMYGISSEEAVGKTIYEMEERKIFNPSVAIRVFKSKKAETLLQLTGAKKYLMCTAIPIKDENNNIVKVISYTRDVTKYESLKDEYNKLSNTLEIYSAELAELRQNKIVFPSVMGSSPAVSKIIKTVDRIANFDANVLFTGESGVGKTMFAKLMHSQSNRKSGPFMEINCGAIPDSLLESELFGYEKGAFTGANKEGKLGLIELANTGTLFLDEIGDLPLHMQVKLLKVIQEKSLIRIGGSEQIKIDFRLIAATNKDLGKMVREGSFREDLFYRLNVITINIPSLRERKEDVFPLCMHFLDKYNDEYGLNRTLSNTVIDYLTEYAWPGNIRELENTIERMVLTSDDYMISEENLPYQIKSNVISPTIDYKQSLKEILESVEKKIILDSFKKHNSTVGVAKELGISQPSASLKLKKYLK